MCVGVKILCVRLCVCVCVSICRWGALPRHARLGRPIEWRERRHHGLHMGRGGRGVCARVSVCVYVCVYVYVFVSVCVYMNVSVCDCVCACMCMCLCACI